MALEQLRAFREGRPQETLGPTEVLEPDGFPLLASSELRAEHGKIGPLLNKLARDLDVDKMRGVPEVGELLKSDRATRTRLYLAMIERTFAYDAKLSRADSNYSDGYFFDYGPAARVMALLFDTGVDAAAVRGRPDALGDPEQGLSARRRRQNRRPHHYAADQEPMKRMERE